MFSFRNSGSTWALALGLFLALASPAANAGAESEIFARLLARVTTSESMTAGRYLLRNSPEIREFSRAVLGTDAAGIAEDRLAETAIRRLQTEGNYRLAQNLEQRLLLSEDDFVSEMTRDPSANMESVLNRLSAERFQTRVFVEGRTQRVEFKTKAPLSAADLELARVLHADPEFGPLREAVRTAAVAAPALKLDEALTAYDGLLKATPELSRFLPKAQVYQQLADVEMSEFTDNLKSTLAAIEKAPAALNAEQKVRYALRRVLRGKVPNGSIGERVRAFMAGEKGAFSRALGDMTLGETQELFYGTDPLNPSADSLLGQYLRETGASTTIRTFDDPAAIEAGTAGAQGPRRLVVSMSEKSMPTFMKLFKRKEWMSIFNHAWMVHDGMVTSHNRAFSEFRIPNSEYTPYPMLLLKPTEGQRMAQYLELFRRDPFTGGWDSRGAAPWNLEGYCARSAWGGGCTQHVGNIPIGDQRVLSYTMPGNQAGANPLNPAPNIQPLKPYALDDALVHRVWKVPGNMQWGETIGLQGANLRGELANPGWLIWSLMGPASVDRVPIVFVTRPDHVLPIDPAFIPRIEGRF